MSLRFLLIIIGVVIIAGVYFATAVKRRRDSRVNYGRRFSRLDVPDVILQHNDDSAEIGRDQQHHDLPELSRIAGSVILPPEDIALDDLPRVRNDMGEAAEPSNARRSNDQLDMFGATSDSVSGQPEASVTDPEEPIAEADNGLINLFIRARENQQLKGPELVRALNAVGMTHGEMSVFHHFGAGELRCTNAIFSAANMFEPGTFDLSRIEVFQTSGIVLFMQLPTELQGPVAFELLLNTAQRLAELTSAELFASPRSPLDAKSIAHLRQRAAHFNNARP